MLAIAAAVLALSAAIVDPYLAAAGNAAASSELERVGDREAGLRIAVRGRMTPQEVAEAESLLAEHVDGLPLRPAERTTTSDPLSVESGGGEQRARLAAHSAASEELERAGEVAGPLVPDVLAQDLGIEQGAEVLLRRGEESLSADVGGVYDALDPATAPPALAGLAELTQAAEGREGRPPDLLFMEGDDAVALAAELRTSLELEWQLPLAGVDGLEEARAARRGMDAVIDAAEDPRTSLGAALRELSSTPVEGDSGIAVVVRESDRAVAALSPTVRAVGLAGQAVALAVAAAAAVFAARQRRVEFRLAAVRGRSPVLQGTRAAMESALPVVAGAIVGWAAALGLVSVFGPPGDLPPGTPARALAATGVSVAPAVAVIAAATAAAVAGTVRGGRRRRVRSLARAPWELAVLALAAVALAQLRLGGGVAIEDGSPSLSPLVLAFPVLLLAACAGLAARALRRTLPALRRRATGSGAAGYLTVRRLGAAPTAAISLTAAASLALGLVVYAAALADSLGSSVTEKAAVQIGADAMAPGSPAEAGAEGTTEVRRVLGRAQPSGETVDVLLIDGATFADVAFWDSGLAAADLDTFVERLEAGDERLPVVAAGLAEGQPVALEVGSARLPVEIAGSPDAFPGQSTRRPAVVADIDSAEAVATAHDTRLGGAARQEVWATGPDAAATLREAGVNPELIRQASDAAEQPRLVAVTWALGALGAFGALAAGLGLAGVVLFVASRQRATQVSYALARRMGLSPSAHRVALAAELLALLGLAAALATAFGMLAAGLTLGQIDPLPDLPPSPRLGVPLPALAALLVTLGAAGMLGAALLQRRADRSDIAEVLRSA